MTEIVGKTYTEERALFGSRDLALENCVFGGEDESPLKECHGVRARKCAFENKYPIWYSRDLDIEDCFFDVGARAGLWYCEDVRLANCVYGAVKGLRRLKNMRLERVSFTSADETLWDCKNVQGFELSARGDYFAMNSENMVFDGLNLVGNYSFDGCKNVQIKNAKILGRDAFWNCENILIKDSYLSGKYFGWNSRRVRLENCVVESLQGFCYIEGLTLENCVLPATSLAFEYSSDVRASVRGRIESVKNPTSGEIIAEQIGEIIGDEIDRKRVKIITDGKEW